MSMLKKVLVTIGSVVLIVIGVYSAYTFLAPSENGKKYVEKIVSNSANTTTPCSWSGFVKHKKADILQVFLGCNVIPVLNNYKITNQNELTEIIHTKAIAPLLNDFPVIENVFITYIAQVKENAVICVDIKNKNIVKTYYDSYDNYCWPQ